MKAAAGNPRTSSIWTYSRAMTIPKFHELFNKVLEVLSDGQEWRAKDFYEHVIDSLNLPEAERSEKLGGGSNRAISRAYFACEYFFKNFPASLYVIIFFHLKFHLSTSEFPFFSFAAFP